MEKQPDNYQDWRDEKATQLRKIENHDNRRVVWEEYKKNDVPFVFTFEPNREVDRFETPLAKNIDIFNLLPSIRTGLNMMKIQGNWFLDYDSKEQRSFMKALAESYLEHRFRDAGLSDIDEVGKKVALKFFLECLRLKIVDDLDKVENVMGKYRDELYGITAHYMSKVFTYFPKTNELRKKFYAFREIIEKGDQDSLVFLKEYNLKTKEMLDDFLQNPEMNFDINDGLNNLERMIIDLENKINKNISV
jgi:hypothetical protein